MPFTSVCPHCQRVYTLADDQAGKRARCRDCKGIFAVDEHRSNEIAVHDAMVVPPPARRAVRRESQAVGFICPFCGTGEAPMVGTKVSTGGWIMFAICISSLCLLPFCWIPLISMKDEYRVCADCGVKLG